MSSDSSVHRSGTRSNGTQAQKRWQRYYTDSLLSLCSLTAKADKYIPHIGADQVCCGWPVHEKTRLWGILHQISYQVLDNPTRSGRHASSILGNRDTELSAYHFGVVRAANLS
jgi:hypothetical protein